MTEPFESAAAAVKARTMAAALALGRGVDRWSLALAILALAGVLWFPLKPVAAGWLLVSIAAGGAQKIFALRVAFDAAQFRHWAAGWSGASRNRGAAPASAEAGVLAADLAAFDQALAACGMPARQGGPPRDLDSRLCGASRLLRRQFLYFAIQFVAMLAAVATRLLPAG